LKKNLLATKSKVIRANRDAVKRMLYETTEIGVSYRYDALPEEIHQYFESRGLDIKAAAIANRRTTAFGATICAVAESLNNSELTMGMRNMMPTSALSHFATYSFDRLAKTYDTIKALVHLG
jgi:hypothetical protein